MARGRKKKKSVGKHVIIVTSIIALNVMGISYANWNDNLQIFNSFTSGDMGLRFSGNVDIKPEDGSTSKRNTGDLKVTFNDDFTTMTIVGKVSPDYKGFVDYGVINAGTIPAKFNQDQYNEDNKQQVPDGLKLSVDQEADILEPSETSDKDNGNGNPKVHIEATKIPGTYNFEVKLPFDQWTN